ncbi:putative Metallothionein, family 15, plant [Helianthus annuus]|nr:putative Metallothionein, family 15, plant [Helianthus annuus]
MMECKAAIIMYLLRFSIKTTQLGKTRVKHWSSLLFKKGFRYDVTVVDTENSTEETIVMEVPAAENKGNCKCGANCSCTNCTCGH